MTDASEFAGTIGRTHHDSVPHWPRPPRPPAAAPNVVFVVLDDLGFADFGCYGSEIATPTIDRLAANGLRYTNFHTTALCSSSRASLLTGRNHHSVGMRMLSNLDTGYPSGRGRVGHDAATIAEMLLDVGFNTMCVGKWHLAPTEATTAAGPYDQWPLGRGFERFHGFLEAETDAFHPELFRDNHAVDPPRSPGSHLTEDLVDQAISMVTNQVSVAPERPFFLHLAFSAPHAPHQAPAEFLAAQRGRWDAGWDVHRAARLERQKAMGLLPDHTVMPPRDPRVPAWSDLSTDEQAVHLRLQEAYAAMVAHTDVQLGRFVAALERLGQLDDTLMVVMSDNGASQEGGVNGSLNPTAFQNRQPEPLDGLVANRDLAGGPDAQSNYGLGWAAVSNSPFKRYKQNTDEGGVRDPLVVHWPAGIADPGGLRHQFLHVIDIVPTVLAVAGVEAPIVRRGIVQQPVHGLDLSPTLADPTAASPRHVQHFEMFGHRGLWWDGWKAVAFHERGTSFDDDVWELYDLDADPAEARDLAAQEPHRLDAMVDRFWVEAETHGVLPLDDRGFADRARIPRPGSPRDRTRFTYHAGMGHLPGAAAPPVMQRSHRITVTLDTATARAETDGLQAPSDTLPDGVLVAHGGISAGYALYVIGGHLVYHYNFLGTHQQVRSREPVSADALILAMAFDVDADAADRGGTVTLSVHDVEVGRGRVARTLPFFLGWEGLDVGRDALTAVSPDYTDEFPFGGVIDRVVFDLAESEHVPFERHD